MSDPTGNGRTKKILLVEDEPDILNFFQSLLENEGFHVTGCTDGEAALKNLKEKKFDLAILDIVLPKMDGFALFKAIQSDPAIRNMPVLVVSGREGMSGTFTAMGVDGFLAKPVEKDTLISEAKRLTRNKVLLMTDSPHVTTKVTRAFEKHEYEIRTVATETELVELGKKNKYRCVVAHLPRVESPPERFREIVAGDLSHKDPDLIIYSDSSVKGLEKNDTVAIDEVVLKWTRAGVQFFYDPRMSLRPFNMLVKDWVCGQ